MSGLSGQLGVGIGSDFLNKKVAKIGPNFRGSNIGGGVEFNQNNFSPYIEGKTAYNGTLFKNKNSQVDINVNPLEFHINNKNAKIKYGGIGLTSENKKRGLKFNVMGGLGQSFAVSNKIERNSGYEGKIAPEITFGLTKTFNQNSKNKSNNAGNQNARFLEMGGIQRFDEGGEYKSQEDYQSHLLDPYSKEKKQAQIQWLTSQAQATASLNDIKNRRKLKDYDIPENTPQNVRQFAEISPTGYTDLENYTRYMMGDSRWDMDKPQTTLADEEAWMKYNNIPHKNKNIIPSKYRPSTSVNSNIIYNKFDDTTDSLMFNDIENKLKDKPYGNIQVGELEMYNGPATKTGFNMYSPMGNFTIGKGKDEKGEYVSYYDKYDFDSAPGFVQSRLPGNEFEFYNRRYLKPKLSAWDQKGEELERARQNLKGKQNKTNK